MQVTISIATLDGTRYTHRQRSVTDPEGTASPALLRVQALEEASQMLNELVPDPVESATRTGIALSGKNSGE